MATTPSLPPSELRARLEADFRQRVTLLYRSLQITPPYHSVEKAVLALRDRLSALSEPTLRTTATDPASQNALFTQVFIDSGLAKKNRGIISKLLADRPELLAPECQPFTDAFKAPP
ncbi:MAG: hypothetical protein E6K59_07240 [Nitrospirae bacterium]|nr:MAG: hypothetical protein E6K59_07240 [Nitrospirota bacterium]